MNMGMEASGGWGSADHTGHAKSLEERIADYDVFNLFQNAIDAAEEKEEDGEDDDEVQINPLNEPGAFAIQRFHEYGIEDGNSTKLRQVVILWPANERITHPEAILLRCDEEVDETVIVGNVQENQMRNGPISVFIVPTPIIDNPLDPKRLADLEQLTEYVTSMLEIAESWETFRRDAIEARKFMLTYQGITE